jgi:hypothetical protein
MTDIFEGSIIRSFRRLQELLRQMGGAARAIGNSDLETKFEDSIKLLERPNTVVFNPSYVGMICSLSVAMLTAYVARAIACICSFHNNRSAYCSPAAYVMSYAIVRKNFLVSCQLHVWI